jgi:hypothetical protein
MFVLAANNAHVHQPPKLAGYIVQEGSGDVPNWLDGRKGWNFMMRLYSPGLSVLDGSYKLPNVLSAK